MSRLVIGIDPGTGLTSPTGFAAFDPDTRELVHATTFTSKLKDARRRVKEVADQVGEALEGIDPDAEVFVFTENTVMRGKGGATFQRLIGAIQSRVPMRMKLGEVQNSTVKRVVGGHGKSDKHQVSDGVTIWMAEGPSVLIVRGFVEQQNWDVTDAIAIGVAGWLLEMNPST